MLTAAAVLGGFLLDLWWGDPLWMPHPVVAVGRLIAMLERASRRCFPATPRGERMAGLLTAAVVCAVAFGVPWAVLALAGWVHPLLRAGLEGWMCYQLLATKSLSQAARAVYTPLAAGDLPAAREAVGRVVGRDTAALNAEGVARATVETVAENTADGVIAPLFYLMLGGAPLGMLYKAVNTMDSMLGYRNERYLWFGRAAARMDDRFNYLPARLCGLLMVPAAALCGLDEPAALRILMRDRRNHASPNAAWPEAACAGALGIRLGGDAQYFGQTVHKPTIGDDTRGILPQDILSTCRLLYGTAGLGLALLLTGRLLVVAALHAFG